MSEAFNMFADSFLKRLKRPEFFNFNPDGAFGANMVHGSESQNPWANRNADNAKYGQLGGTQPLKQMVVGATDGGQIPGLNITNLPGGNSNSQSTFNNLLTAASPVVVKGGSDWLAGNGLDRLREMFGMENPEVKEVTNQALEHMLNGTTPMSGTESAVENTIMGGPTTGVERTVESFGNNAVSEGVKDAVIPTSFDPTSIATSAIPIATKMLGLKGSVGRGVDAAANVGAAAAQGGLNPLSDASALMSLVRFFGGLF